MDAAPAHLPPVALREDVLVSICFGDLASDHETFDAIAALAAMVDARFRFREIIVVADDSRRADYLPLIRRVANVRLFTVRDGTAYYRRRVIAAEEAIGDVVLLVSSAELGCVDPIEMIERAADEQRGVLATRRPKIRHGSPGSVLVLLGRLAGFKVNPRDLQSLALPRTLLNQLLAHPDPDLALRFPPRDPRVPLAFIEVAAGVTVPRNAGLRRRLDLLQKLLVYMAPNLLLAVTLASAFLAMLGFLYGLYVVAAWILVHDLAPGWLTLSAVLSLSMVFLGISITGLSLGLQQLLSRTNGGRLDSVAAEVNRIDLFGQVASDLNVDFEHDLAGLRQIPKP